jgi:NAD(P)H-dependent FMN reductase
MPPSKPKIGIVISTTREGRFGDRPTRWLFDIASARAEADFEVVDLRDYPLPFFNELASPVHVAPKNEVAQRFGEKIAEFDGYIFITAEYNHGIPAVLKNAIDHVYPQLQRKPAAFVGYGGVGGARAIEHLRLILIELQAAPLRNAVHIGLAEFLGLLQQGKAFSDYPYLEQSATLMLDDLLWWARALKTARDAIGGSETEAAAA